MPTTKVPEVKAITDPHTGKFLRLEGFPEFNHHMRRTEPLYALASNFADERRIPDLERAQMLLNLFADQSAQRLEALTRRMMGGEPMMYEVTTEGARPIPGSFDHVLEMIHEVEKIICQIENKQTDMAINSAMGLRNNLIKNYKS